MGGGTPASMRLAPDDLLLMTCMQELLCLEHERCHTSPLPTSFADYECSRYILVDTTYLRAAMGNFPIELPIAFADFLTRLYGTTKAQRDYSYLGQ